MTIHVIFPKLETIEDQKQLQSLKFSAATRRLPLLFFWIFMGVAVLVAGCLAHNRSSWQAFWNQEAVLNRPWALSKIPLGVFFDSLTSEINKIFVRGGWIVAGLIIIMVQAFYIAVVMVRRDRVPELQFIRNLEFKKMVAIEVTVLVLSTFYFLSCTWIFNLIADETGSCTSSANFTFPVSKNNCQADFRGFDISGHCFLIVHSCLLALEYAAKLLFVWRAKERKPNFDKDSDVESVAYSDDETLNDPNDNANTNKNADTSTYNNNNNNNNYNNITLSAPKSNDKFNRNYSKYRIILFSLISLVFLLCLSEFFVFLQTILFYHTVLEKILGTFIGAGFWFALFILSQKYPHLF